MEQRTTDPDHELERTGDELEERIDKLDVDIDESKKAARARSEDTDPFDKDDDDAADEDDGGGDPAGFDDPEADEDDDEDF